MTFEEKLRRLLIENDDRTEKNGAAIGEHLRDEDFMRLIENEFPADTDKALNGNGDAAVVNANFASLRRHLAACDACLDQFRDFYAFSAPAATGETVAGKGEVDAAWKAFAPRIIKNEIKPKFWARLFSTERKSNYFAAFGWSFAALLLIFSGVAFFVARQALNENSQLAAQLEQQKQSSEQRLQSLEETARNSNIAENDKNKLQTEKDQLQNQIAQLQSEIERAKQTNAAHNKTAAPPIAPNSPAENPDNSLVAVNTPIYDVFPADAVVRGGSQSANKLVVPNQAKNVVLILNAAGRADFPVYQAALVNGAGKIVWRGGGLRKDATGNFTLTIARAALKTENYQLKLSSGANTVAEYPIAVEIGK